MYFVICFWILTLEQRGSKSLINKMMHVLFLDSTLKMCEALLASVASRWRCFPAQAAREPRKVTGLGLFCSNHKPKTHVNPRTGKRQILNLAFYAF